MTRRAASRPLAAFLAAALLTAPRSAPAHFLWVTVEPAGSPAGAATVRAFLNEEPAPGGPEFLKYVRDVRPTVDGRPLPARTGEEAVEALWAGKLPPTIDAARDPGVRTRGGASYRLYYTARAQTAPASARDDECGDKLRARLVVDEGKAAVQVLFDGKPVAGARIKVYPDGGAPEELTADVAGLAAVAGVAEGKAALWANWGDGKAGEVGGKPFSETRYYATLTFHPQDGAVRGPSAFAEMPAPAVNSFGGAVLGDWLYVYSGHVGRTHQYSVETTSRHFRRLNLKDRTTWEDLPMGKDVQGVALVTDGKSVYRVGGMSARNQPGHEHDLHSVADFARFDPDSGAWTDLPPLPQARSTHDAVVIGRTVYAVGGWTMRGASDEAQYLENAAAFDLDHPERGWRTIEQPFRRRALSAGEAGGKLYVLGGLNDVRKVERRVDVYDPTTGLWTIGPELPGTGRTDGFGTSAFGVEGHLYHSGASGRIYRLDARGGAWEPVGAWAQPRITHRLLPGPDHTLLAVGGNAKGKQIPIIEAVALSPPTSDGAGLRNRLGHEQAP
jgi:hypothetical protein